MPLAWIVGYPYRGLGSKGLDSGSEAKFPGVVRWTFELVGDVLRQRSKASSGGRAKTLRRRHLHLPSPPWFQERLSSASVDLESKISSVHLYGLVHLQAGCVFESALTPMSEEAKLQWEFMSHPHDFYWGKVDKLWRLESPSEVFSQHPGAARTMRRLRARDDVLPVQRGPGLTVPVIPDGRFVCAQAGQKLHLELDELVTRARSSHDDEVGPATVMALMLPHCLASLVWQGKWRDLGLLSRWGPLFPMWPSQEWSNPREWVHVKQSSFWESTPTEDLLLPRVFQTMASTIRDLGSSVPADRQDELRLIVEWMDDCQTVIGGLSPQALSWNKESGEGLGRGRAQLASEVLLSAFLASRNMSSKRKRDLQMSVRHWVDACIPPGLRSAVHMAMTPSSLPSTETIRQAQLSVDAAMCLHARQADIFADTVSYMWWDSTPHGKDWLLSQIHSVRKSSLVDVLEAARMVLVATHNQPARAAEAERIVEKSKFVTQHITAHSFLPVAIGLRASALPNKVAALFHALFLETGSIDGIKRFCESLVSVTSDLGTESGLCDFHATDIADFVPAWLQPPNIEADGVDEPQADAPSSAWDAAWLLPNAIMIPGMLHIVSNILADAHSRLSYWDTFHGQLKALSKLLCHPPRRDRFVRMCVKSSPWSHMVDLVDCAFPDMYEKRWHHVLQFGKRVQSIWGMLKSCWKPRLYQEGHSGRDGHDQVADDDFSISSVTSCLGDPMFPAYLAMVVEVDRVAEGLGSWAEGCPCHETTLSRIVSSSKRRKVVAKLCGTFGQNRAGGDGCRLAGKRAWELALGKVRDVASRGVGLAIGKLTVEFRPSLSEHQWVLLTTDFTSAQAIITADLDQKLNFWDKLPWFLCALAAPDPQVSRQAAVQAIRKFEQHGDLPGHAHHRTTLKFLQPGGLLRADVDRYIAGASLADLPALHNEIAKLAFVPVVERIIEARASHVRRALVKAGRASGVHASLELRLGELQENMAKTPNFLDLFLLVWREARYIRRLPTLLGLDNHPDIVSVWQSERPSRSAYIRVLSQVMYRTDLVGQFENPKEGAETHRRLSGRRERATNRILDRLHGSQARPCISDTVFLEAFRRHICDLSDLNKIYSVVLPLGDGEDVAALPLGQILYGAGGVPPLADFGDLDVDGEEVAEPGEIADIVPPPDAPVPGEHPIGREIFFRFIDAKPSKGRYVHLAAAAGRNRLRQTDILVSLLSGGRPSPDGVPRVALQACADGSMTTTVLRNVFSNSDCASSMQAWSLGQSSYSLQGFVDDDQVTSVVTELVRASAFSASRARALSDPAGSALALQKLITDGFVGIGEDEGVHFLTSSCLQHLRSTVECVEPRSLGEIREGVSLELLSDWELMKELEQQGWTWIKFSDRLDDYRIGGPLLWSTRGFSERSVHRDYLMCLLTLQDIQSEYPAITSVPHGRSATVYAKLLQGIPAPALLALHDVEADSPSGVVVAVGGDGDVAAIEWDAVADADDQQSSSAHGGLGEDGSRSDESGDSGRRGGGTTPGCSERGISPGHSEEEPDNAEDSGRDEHGVDELELFEAAFGGVDVAEGAGVIAEDVDEAVAPAAILPPPVLGAYDRAVNHDWGVFRVTIRPPRGDRFGKFGAWFARCPFHKFSAKTLCSREMSIAGPTLDDRRLALYSLYEWCNAAVLYDRRIAHRGHPKPTMIEDILPIDVLEAQRPSDPPDPSDLKTDAQLDAEALGAGDVAPGRRGRGRGRGRRGRGGRGRAHVARGDGPLMSVEVLCVLWIIAVVGLAI